MRITFALPSYPWKPIGGFRVVYEYANGLAALGHEVTVVHARRLRQPSLDQPKNWYRKLRRLGGRLRDILLRPSVQWQEIDPRVHMTYVPEPRPRFIPDGEVVFATAWQTAEYVNEYPASKGRKYYLIQHYETWSGPSDRVDATWRMPFKKVVIAKWLYEKGLELGVPAEDMKHIPNGIDLKKFRVTKDIATRPKRVAMLYHPTWWKGAADGLKALEIAYKAHPDLRAVLFGTSSRPSGLPSWIEYWENPPQEVIVDSIYNGSSIYLCPSVIEGWGLPAAEAMACGCAVVSTDNGGVRDYITHGETGLLSPPREPLGLANNLLALLANDTLRIQLAERGNSSIQHFTWERALIELCRFIEH